MTLETVVELFIDASDIDMSATNKPALQVPEFTTMTINVVPVEIISDV